AGFAGMAIGAAVTGLRPIVEFMSWNFSLVAADQIISNAAKMYYMTGGKFSVPIVFRGPNGAAAQVSCQHSHSLEALYANFPGLIIVAPCTPFDAKGLLKSSIRSNNPVLFLENELQYHIQGEVPTEEYTVPLGKARMVQEGKDITIIGYSRMISVCLEAISVVKNLGISVELIDLRTIKPLDVSSILRSVHKTGKCLIVEEGHYFSGIGAEIAATLVSLAFDSLDAPVLRVTQKETPMPYSKILEANSLPNADRVVEAIKKLMG
ncbi:MAG: alpha-ketoacid dehydrogenase subunit beta, partial [Victivallaceae bacterium]